MSIRTWIKQKFLPKATLTLSEALKRLIAASGGTPTASGVSVSPDTAMRQATVYSCVNILSRVAGMLPCHVMRKEGKIRSLAEDFYLYELLHDQPNEWMTAPEFWGMAMNHVVLRGNFFAIKNRGLSLTGPVRELIPLAPGVVNEVKQLPNYELVYKCTFPDGTKKDVPGSQIMHLRGMVVNGYMGVNPIQYMREAIGFAIGAEEFGARYFGQGLHPGAVIEQTGPSLKDPAAFRMAADEVYGGLGKSHRIMLLESGMKYQKITIDPKDAQFLELRKFQKSEIVDIFFGHPLTVMNSGENTPTYASAEQFNIGFIIYAVMPWLVNFEKAIRRDLLSPDERKTYYAKFQERGLQRGSFKEQMEGFQIAVNTEILSPNECREMMDKNPYDGGDEYRTRTSTVKDSKGDKGNEPKVQK